MIDLAELGALSITMPNMFSITSALMLSIFGFITFRRGRRLKTPRLTCCGLVLMVYPDFVADPWLMWGVGLALFWLASRKWVPAAKERVA